jgi:TRAP transporter TAXI family solute receptor
MVAANTEILLRLHNISMKDLKIRHLAPGEAMEALGDGLIDVAVLYSALPSSAVNSLAVKNKVRLVTGDEKVLKGAETRENILCFYVLPETYKGQSEGAFAWSVVGATYFNEATSPEDVYNWTKVIMEHKDVLQKVHPLGKEVRLVNKKELEISPIALHPGILKYAKEVGVSY